jgi:hypothetical protein
LRGGPRGFRPGFPCPAVLRYPSSEATPFRVRDSYPLWCGFPSASATTRLCNSPTRRQTDRDGPYNPRTTTTAVYHVGRVWALPFSLATTQGVEVSFLSSGYLDVSVPQLASTCPMDSGRSTRALPRVSFLIRRSRDQRSVSTSPGLIAAAHVLHRLLAPRHPPCALVLLIRKEHVDVAMEFSRCARARSAPAVTASCLSESARPTRRPLARTRQKADGPRRHSPSKLNSVRSSGAGRIGRADTATCRVTS